MYKDLSFQDSNPSYYLNPNVKGFNVYKMGVAVNNGVVFKPDSVWVKNENLFMFFTAMNKDSVLFVFDNRQFRKLPTNIWLPKGDFGNLKIREKGISLEVSRDVHLGELPLGKLRRGEKLAKFYIFVEDKNFGSFYGAVSFN